MERLCLVVLCVFSTSCIIEKGADDDDDDDSRPDAGIVGPRADAAGSLPRGCIYDEPSCTGDNICVSNNCESAWGQIYRFTFTSGEVPTTKNDGSGWDVGGGAPDLFAAADIDGDVYYSSAVDDSFSAVWGEYFDAFVVRASVLNIALWDFDAVENDLAFFCVFDPVPISGLKNGFFLCTGAPGASLIVNVELL